jgi:hypothetical protein
MNPPEGWKLVPVEPTEEMINKADAYAVSGAHEGNYRSYLAEIFRIMLAAEPTPPAQEVAYRGETSNQVADHKAENVSNKSPAQEDESVCQMSYDGIKWVDIPEESFKTWNPGGSNPMRRKLYTRPADDKLTTRVQYRESFQRGAASCDKLRKAAEEVVRSFDNYMIQESLLLDELIVSIENLRAALEK